MMKRLFVVLVAVIGSLGAAVANELPKSIDELVAKLPDAQLKERAVVAEARTNSAFYSKLKSSNWTFDGVVLPRSQVVQLAASKGDYDAFDAREAIRYLQIPAYKSYVAAKLQGYGQNVIEAYDWLQKQRLVVVEVNPKDADKKGEFLAVIAEQVIAQDKAKAKSQ